MGLKGKLISQMEMKCAGDLLHEHFKSNPHQTSTMSPDKITNFTLHEGQLGNTGSVVSWKYVLGGKERHAKQALHIDDAKKSITFNFLEGYMNELYKSMTATLTAEGNWMTWTLVYEKLNENIPEPLDLLELAICLLKDLEPHHVGK
ncbi:kirola-like [Nicotiana tomentosiformis]|uniref:kirola-like n=1 Tax=Nicotiana tomentosiformis TaxID=4098 RepID=UPI00051BA0FE|nr:kirola-like [Nicotiana tomentosiformis]